MYNADAVPDIAIDLGDAVANDVHAPFVIQHLQRDLEEAKQEIARLDADRRMLTGTISTLQLKVQLLESDKEVLADKLDKATRESSTHKNNAGLIARSNQNLYRRELEAEARAKKLAQDLREMRADRDSWRRQTHQLRNARPMASYIERGRRIAQLERQVARLKRRNTALSAKLLGVRKWIERQGDDVPLHTTFAPHPTTPDGTVIFSRHGIPFRTRQTNSNLGILIWGGKALEA